MIRYVFREDEPLRIKAAGKADPQMIGEALEKISETAKGELTPKAVVDAARSKRHPLHVHFEWDDSIAAENYRVDQARSLIRVIRVHDEATPEPARAFISINSRTGTSYRSLADVKRSPDFQQAVMAQADKDLEAFQRRYRELTDICEFVSAARDRIKEKQSKLETRAA
jgi:hypothetical protein